MIELLKEQLKAKDEQIRALNEQLKAKDETLKNAMRITENTQILLKNQQEKSMPAIEEKHKEQLDQEKKGLIKKIIVFTIGIIIGMLIHSFLIGKI